MLIHIADGGELVPIGLVTIGAALVQEYRCKVCGKTYDDSDYSDYEEITDED